MYVHLYVNSTDELLFYLLHIPNLDESTSLYKAESKGRLRQRRDYVHDLQSGGLFYKRTATPVIRRGE